MLKNTVASQRFPLFRVLLILICKFAWLKWLSCQEKTNDRVCCWKELTFDYWKERSRIQLPTSIFIKVYSPLKATHPRNKKIKKQIVGINVLLCLGLIILIHYKVHELNMPPIFATREVPGMCAIEQNVHLKWRKTIRGIKITSLLSSFLNEQAIISICSVLCSSELGITSVSSWAAPLFETFRDFKIQRRDGNDNVA